MHTVPERVFESLPWPQFTTQDLAALLPGSADRRYGLVKRALAGGEIIRIRRHALLRREYVKGRDWYDFLWYTSRRVGINSAFLSSALRQQGPWQQQDLQVDWEWCRKHLEGRINAANWAAARDDVRRFVRVSEYPSLDLLLHAN